MQALFEHSLYAEHEHLHFLLVIGYFSKFLKVIAIFALQLRCSRNSQAGYSYSHPKPFHFQSAVEVGTIGLVSLHENMIGVRRMVHGFWRQVHTKTREGPSENLKKKVAEIETKRKSKSPRKTQVFIQVPDSMEWLDTPTMPMIIIAVGTAVVAKLLMTVCLN